MYPAFFSTLGAVSINLRLSVELLPREKYISRKGAKETGRRKDIIGHKKAQEAPANHWCLLCLWWPIRFLSALICVHPRLILTVRTGCDIPAKSRSL